jgi:hypothetical protein
MVSSITTFYNLDILYTGKIKISISEKKLFQFDKSKNICLNFVSMVKYIIMQAMELALVPEG